MFSQEEAESTPQAPVSALGEAQGVRGRLLCCLGEALGLHATLPGAVQSARPGDLVRLPVPVQSVSMPGGSGQASYPSSRTQRWGEAVLIWLCFVDRSRLTNWPETGIEMGSSER